MGCVDCNKQGSTVENELNFSEFVGLFENPRNVTVSGLKVVYYKKWYIQVTVTWTDDEGETQTKKMNLGVIN